MAGEHPLRRQTAAESGHSETPCRQGGDHPDAGDLFPALYTQLRKLAQGRIGRLAPGGTLAATDLVHEAYLRLAQRELTFDDTRHLLFAASRAMHDILVERARKKATGLGGKRRRCDLDKLTGAQTSGPL